MKILNRTRWSGSDLAAIVLAGVKALRPGYSVSVIDIRYARYQSDCLIRLPIRGSMDTIIHLKIRNFEPGGGLAGLAFDRYVSKEDYLELLRTIAVPMGSLPSDLPEWAAELPLRLATPEEVLVNRLTVLEQKIAAADEAVRIANAKLAKLRKSQANAEAKLASVRKRKGKILPASDREDS